MSFRIEMTPFSGNPEVELTAKLVSVRLGNETKYVANEGSGKMILPPDLTLPDDTETPPYGSEKALRLSMAAETLCNMLAVVP
jgi:hypothetical protein